MTSEIIEEHVDEIKELYLSDIPITHIARDFGIPKSSLYGYISKNPNIFPRRRYRRRISEEESSEFYSEWINGSTITDIAKQHHVSTAAVCRHIKQINLCSKPLFYKD